VTMATPLCHFVTSPPQGGRSGTRGDRSVKQFSPPMMAANWIDLPGPCAQSVGVSGGQGARHTQSPPLWGRCHEVTEGGIVPHTVIPPSAHANARRLRKNLTDAELKLWNELRAHRLMGIGFRRQFPISGYIVDFACPTHRLIVELDGSQHANEDRIAYDQQRTTRLERDGWTVVRFWNDDVLKDIDNVCQHILLVIRDRLIAEKEQWAPPIS